MWGDSHAGDCAASDADADADGSAGSHRHSYSGDIAGPHTHASARRLRDDDVWCCWHGAGWKRHVSRSEARRVDGLGF
jgi:hypothetical protein